MKREFGSERGGSNFEQQPREVQVRFQESDRRDGTVVGEFDDGFEFSGPKKICIIDASYRGAMPQRREVWIVTIVKDTKPGETGGVFFIRPQRIVPEDAREIRPSPITLRGVPQDVEIYHGLARAEGSVYGFNVSSADRAVQHAREEVVMKYREMRQIVGREVAERYPYHAPQIGAVPVFQVRIPCEIPGVQGELVSRREICDDGIYITRQFLVEGHEPISVDTNLLTKCFVRRPLYTECLDYQQAVVLFGEPEHKRVDARDPWLLGMSWGNFGVRMSFETALREKLPHHYATFFLDRQYLRANIQFAGFDGEITGAIVGIIGMSEKEDEYGILAFPEAKNLVYSRELTAEEKDGDEYRSLLRKFHDIQNHEGEWDVKRDFEKALKILDFIAHCQFPEIQVRVATWISYGDREADDLEDRYDSEYSDFAIMLHEKNETVEIFYDHVFHKIFHRSIKDKDTDVYSVLQTSLEFYVQKVKNILDQERNDCVQKRVAHRDSRALKHRLEAAIVQLENRAKKVIAEAEKRKQYFFEKRQEYIEPIVLVVNKFRQDFLTLHQAKQKEEKDSGYSGKHRNEHQGNIDQDNKYLDEVQREFLQRASSDPVVQVLDDVTRQLRNRYEQRVEEYGAQDKRITKFLYEKCYKQHVERFSTLLKRGWEPQKQGEEYSVYRRRYELAALLYGYRELYDKGKLTDMVLQEFLRAEQELEDILQGKVIFIPEEVAQEPSKFEHVPQDERKRLAEGQELFAPFLEVYQKILPLAQRLVVEHFREFSRQNNSLAVECRNLWQRIQGYYVDYNQGNLHRVFLDDWVLLSKTLFTKLEQAQKEVVIEDFEHDPLSIENHRSYLLGLIQEAKKMAKTPAQQKSLVNFEKSIEETGDKRELKSLEERIQGFYQQHKLKMEWSVDLRDIWTNFENSVRSHKDFAEMSKENAPEELLKRVKDHLLKKGRIKKEELDDLITEVFLE